MAQKTNIIPITVGGKEYIPRFSSLFARAFATDPIITYLLHHMSPSQRSDYLPTYFDALLGAAGMNNCILAEADDFKSCGMLMPPGCHVDNFWTLLPAGIIGLLWDVGIACVYRMMGELGPAEAACRTKALRGQAKYYYMFFHATEDGARERGLCSMIIRRWQDIAQKDGLPIWLEATTERSKRVYAKCGFEMVEEIIVGKGKVGDDGLVKAGGEGVTTRGMIWWPKSEDGKNMYPVTEKGWKLSHTTVGLVLLSLLIAYISKCYV